MLSMVEGWRFRELWNHAELEPHFECGGYYHSSLLLILLIIRVVVKCSLCPTMSGHNLGLHFQQSDAPNMTGKLLAIYLLSGGGLVPVT